MRSSQDISAAAAGRRLKGGLRPVCSGTKLACKLDCRTTAAPADLGACLRGCTDTFRGLVKETCQSDRQGCLDVCDPTTPDGDPACRGVCGSTLGACARQVAADIRTCVTDCGTASDRLACLEDCGATAQSGAEDCAAVFEGCVGDCDTAPPPPPPTPTTTLPPIPSCASAEAPTCGGSCASATQECVAVSAAVCACVRGAPE